jgi:CBS domain-containing protein
MERATRIATRLGVIIGYLFIIGGVFVIFTGDVISGIWFGAIGWFLQNAAAQSMHQFRMQSTVQGVVAGALMQRNPPVVDPGVPIDRLVEHYFIGQNLRGVPVVQQDVLLGIITLTDLRSTPQSEWPSLRVADRMTPRYRLITVTPESPIEVAMQAMSEHDVHQIPVVEGGMLVGLLTRSTIIRYLQLNERLPEDVKV